VHNLITTKTKKAYSLDSWAKHPRKFVKQDANRRIRRLGAIKSTDLVEEEIPKYSSSTNKFVLRKRNGICPVCLGHLRKNSKGTRYQRICENCNAVYNFDIRCPSCNTYRVWSGKLGRWCKGCGHEVKQL